MAPQTTGPGEQLLEGDELDLRLGCTVAQQLRRDRLYAEVVSPRRQMLTVRSEIGIYRCPTTALSCVAKKEREFSARMGRKDSKCVLIVGSLGSNQHNPAKKKRFGASNLSYRRMLIPKAVIFRCHRNYA